MAHGVQLEYKAHPATHIDDCNRQKRNKMCCNGRRSTV